VLGVCGVGVGFGGVVLEGLRVGWLCTRCVRLASASKAEKGLPELGIVGGGWGGAWERSMRTPSFTPL